MKIDGNFMERKADLQLDVKAKNILFWQEGNLLVKRLRFALQTGMRLDRDSMLYVLDTAVMRVNRMKFGVGGRLQAVETMVQNFVTDLLNSIRERGIDTKSTYTVFIGGGAVLLERFLEQADRLGKHTFIRDMKANADGYDLLYRMTQAGV